MRRVLPLVIALLVMPSISCVRFMGRHQTDAECSVHNIRLKKDTVRIYYGLPPRPTDEYISSTKRKFPNAGGPVNGGCIVNPFFRWARIKSCSKCTAVRSKWLETNPRYQYELDRKSEVADQAVEAGDGS